ncbi:hypothetical protein ACHAXS_005097 [Conticribra weissflogii]
MVDGLSPLFSFTTTYLDRESRQQNLIRHYSKVDPLLPTIHKNMPTDENGAKIIESSSIDRLAIKIKNADSNYLYYHRVIWISSNQIMLLCAVPSLQSQ